MRTRLNSELEFRTLQAACEAARECEKRKILVCCGTGCVAGGSLKIFDKLKERMEELGLPCKVELALEPEGDVIGLKKSGCHGFCEMGPLVRIEPEGWLYTKCKVEDVDEIIDTTIINGEFIERLGYSKGGTLHKRQEDIPFYKLQTRRVLEHCGHIASESIEEYFSIGGYSALCKALFEMSAEEIINEVTESGLRGRGGAGFPTGRKWSQVAANAATPKYVVCNGDEGDPGAFMDRSCMEGDPHKIIEGMIIAGISTNSTEGYIYVRAEYPLAVKRLTIAIEQAKEYANKLCDESEIVIQSQEKANLIMEQAKAQEQDIMDKTMQNSRQLKENAENYANQVFDHMISNVSNALSILQQAKEELNRRQGASDEMIGD